APAAGIEERWLVAEDGRRLHAWYAPPRHGAPVLLWSHGNAGNIHSRQPLIVALAGRGLGVLAYDYRGYGRSEGVPSEEGVYLDARAAFDDLVTRGYRALRHRVFRRVARRRGLDRGGDSPALRGGRRRVHVHEPGRRGPLALRPAGEARGGALRLAR